MSRWPNKITSKFQVSSLQSSFGSNSRAKILALEQMYPDAHKQVQHALIPCLAYLFISIKQEDHGSL